MKKKNFITLYYEVLPFNARITAPCQPGIIIKSGPTADDQNSRISP
jgi:hypothetical protein